MTFTDVIYTGFYYLYLPIYIAIVNVLSWILLLLSPVLHVGHYLLHATVIVPLQLLSRFESVYIFLGVAAVVGIITGSVLHVSSGVVMALLNLESVESGRKTSQSISDGKTRGYKRKPQVLQASHSGLSTDYKDWLDKDRGSKARGLVSQTILEEDDSSDIGY